MSSITTSEVNSVCICEQSHEVDSNNPRDAKISQVAANNISKQQASGSSTINTKCVCAKQTLTTQFTSGVLQQQVIAKIINPHTLIHQAILENSPEVIRFLLAQGVSVDYPDENGMSPLTMAILNRCNYAVATLLDHGANTNPTVKWNGMGLLELAFKMTDTSSAKLLIEHGVDVNAWSKNNYHRALSMAIVSALNNHGSQKLEFINLVKLLINRGADVHPSKANNSNIIDYPLFLALHLAEHRKAEAEGLSILDLVIKKGADVNIAKSAKSSSTDGETPLLRVISINDFNLVKFLVESGADVNKITTNNGKRQTPLTFALERSLDPRITQYLVQQGAR